jgi:predicted Zn-dependent protease with MMP-like domain
MAWFDNFQCYSIIPPDLRKLVEAFVLQRQQFAKKEFIRQESLELWESF